MIYENDIFLSDYVIVSQDKLFHILLFFSFVVVIVKPFFT